MTCNKCGANIEENSKFCGYCGNPVEIKDDPQINGDNNPVVEKSINEIDLEKTVRIEPIQSVLNENLNFKSVENVNFSQEKNTQGQANEFVNQSQVESKYGSNQEISNGVQNISQPAQKKNNKLLIIVGGILLAVVAIVLVVVSFLKSSDDSIMVLERVLNKLSNSNTNSVAVDTGISIATTTGESFSLSLTVKGEKKSSDEIDMQMTLNKSLLFDEMNVYLTTSKEEMTMYLESSLVDLLGMTSSLEPVWLYYTLPLDELPVEKERDNIVEEIKLKDIIDRKHFKYVNEKDDLRHYVFIIDQKLIDNMKSKLSNVDNEEIKEMLDSMETLEETIKLDLYITKNDELSKIELNMSEYLKDDENISDFVLSMSIRDINNTNVEIPNDAKNSIVDLETYISSNANLNSDSSREFNDSFLEEENYNYDNMLDFNLNDTLYEF